MQTERGLKRDGFVIRTDTLPEVTGVTRQGLCVYEHRKYNEVIWNRHLVKFGHSQHKGQISLERFVTEFTEEPVANATILDCLLKYSRLIPRSWKTEKKIIYFLGTVYFESNLLRKYVRSLHMSSNGKWESYYNCFEDAVDTSCAVAAILVLPPKTEKEQLDHQLYWDFITRKEK